MAKANVADDGTKWQGKPDMDPAGRWFRGPDFLWETEDKWPVSPNDPGETTEEVRHSVLHHVKYEPVIDFARFSRWKTLLRVVGYIHRFIGNIRKRKQRVTKIAGWLISPRSNT